MGHIWPRAAFVNKALLEQGRAHSHLVLLLGPPPGWSSVWPSTDPSRFRSRIARVSPLGDQSPEGPCGNHVSACYLPHRWGAGTGLGQHVGPHLQSHAALGFQLGFLISWQHQDLGSLPGVEFCSRSWSSFSQRGTLRPCFSSYALVLQQRDRFLGPCFFQDICGCFLPPWGERRMQRLPETSLLS